MAPRSRLDHLSTVCVWSCSRIILVTSVDLLPCAVDAVCYGEMCAKPKSLVAFLYISRGLASHCALVSTWVIVRNFVELIFYKYTWVHLPLLFCCPLISRMLCSGSPELSKFNVYLWLSGDSGSTHESLTTDFYGWLEWLVIVVWWAERPEW